MRRSAAGFNPAYLVLLVAGCLYAIFYLPSLVSPPPTASASFVFGYNNRLGILLLLLSLAACAIFTKGFRLQPPITIASPNVSKRTLAACLFAVFIGCGLMFLLAGRFGGFGESSYEIDRVWLLSLGKTPYVNFEWPFGVAFLYGPLLLRSLCGITLVQGYYAFWTLNYLVGTWLLFAVVNRINYPAASKRTIFLLVFASGYISILTMGTHYTFLRYTLPLYCILLIESVVKPGGTNRQVYGSLLAVLCTTVLLTISPETAIAFAFACACILPPPATAGRRSIGVYAAALLILAGVFAVALKLHVLDTMRASGGGADSFPIIPAPHILLFFLSLFICACYLYNRLKDRRFDDNTIGLLAFSLPMLAAALGRCDPFHVSWNGEGVLLASLFYTSNYKQAWKVYVFAYSLFLIVLPAVTTTWVYLPSIGYARQVVLRGNGSSPVDKTIVWAAHASGHLRNLLLPGKQQDTALPGNFSSGNPSSIAALYPAWHGKYLAPFGYKPNGLGTYLSLEVEYGRYEGFENANTPAAVALKLAEIAQQPEKALLLPPSFEEACRPNPLIEAQKMSVLFAYPYVHRPTHSEAVHQPVCEYIHSHYTLLVPANPANHEYELWTLASSPQASFSRP